MVAMKATGRDGEDGLLEPANSDHSAPLCSLFRSLCCVVLCCSPALEVVYFIATDPKLKFYATQAQRDNGMIHGADMSEEDLLALLMAGPDESKEPILSLELADNDPTPQDLRDMMQQHGLVRALEPNEEHTAMHIFKAGFTPVED